MWQALAPEGYTVQERKAGLLCIPGEIGVMAGNRVTVVKRLSLLCSEALVC